MRFYNDGYIKTKIYASRRVRKTNYNPMCWHLLDYENTVQVFIKTIGGFSWINIQKNQIEKEE